MPAVQSSYAATQAAAFVGMIANSEPRDVVSRVAEGGIGFGVPVIQGSDAQGVKAMAAGVFNATAGAVVGTGNGVITMATPNTGAGVKLGVYNVNFVEPITNLGTFQVEDPDGVVVGNGFVGTAFTGVVKFTIADGSTDFLAGDRIPITVAETGIPRIEGITVADKTVPPANADAFVDGDVLGVMKIGVIWVTAGATVLRGEQVFVTAAGAFTNVDGGGANIRFPGAEFESGASSAALVKIRLAGIHRGNA